MSHQPLFQHVSLSGSTTDSRVWQHHHYPIACHLLSGVFYIFSALFVLSGKYNDISKNHTTSFCFVLLKHDVDLALFKAAVLQKLFCVEQQWCKLIWLTPRRELVGFPTGIHHTSKSPLTLESALTFGIPGENLMLMLCEDWTSWFLF